MVKLWFYLEFCKSNKLNGKEIIKFINIYIIPTLITSLLVYWINISSFLTTKGVILTLISFNLIIITTTYFVIHKYFFATLERDVLIKFLDNKMNDYIKLRLFMILIKFNLPFIIPTILCFKEIVEIFNFVYILNSIVFLIIWFLINYLIVLYSRYLINILKEKLKKIIYMAIIIYSLIVVILAQLITILILKEIKLRVIDEVPIDCIELNSGTSIVLLALLVIVLILLKKSNDHLKVNIKKIIINKSYSKNIKNKNELSIKFNLVLKALSKFLLKNLTYKEKVLVIKDIRSFYRENKIVVPLLIFFEVIINGFMIMIYWNINSSKLPRSIEIFLSISILTIFFMAIKFVFFGLIALRNIIKIDEDLNLFKRYNIAINKESIIKTKKNFINIILFYPSLVFYLIAFIIKFDPWGWLGLILSIIPSLILSNLLSLKLIIATNKKLNDGTLSVLNIVTISICSLVVLNLFNLKYSEDLLLIMFLWIVLNTAMTIQYFLDLNIDKINKKLKRNKEKII